MRSTKKLSSFGCLDGIDFLLFGFSSSLDMGGHIAVAGFPFQGRVWCGNAIHAGGIFRQSLASHAFIHNRQAVAFIIAAAGGCHEYAVIPFSNSRTDHDTIFLNPYGFNLSAPLKTADLHSMQGASAVFFRFILNFERQTLLKYHKTKPDVNHRSFFFRAISFLMKSPWIFLWEKVMDWCITLMNEN